jgi:hypothetical protein
MLLLALALSLAASDPAVDPTPTQHRLRVLVSVDLRTANNSVHVSEVMDDVRAIWMPYLDLEFDGKDAISNTPYDDQVRVAIVDRPKPRSSLDAAPLGWIDFRAPGKPSNTVTRGIAHELGHHLLRSSAHASDRLMRPRLTVFDMVVPGTDLFRLLPDQIKLLERRTATGMLAEVPSSPREKPAAPGSPAAITSRSAGVQTGRVVLRGRRTASSAPTLISERPESRSDSFWRALVSAVG